MDYTQSHPDCTARATQWFLMLLAGGGNPYLVRESLGPLESECSPAVKASRDGGLSIIPNLFFHTLWVCCGSLVWPVE